MATTPNIRKSFFGGSVSTRMKCETVGGTIAPGPSNPINSTQPSKKRLKSNPAAEKQRVKQAAAQKAKEAAAKRKELEQRLKEALKKQDAIHGDSTKISFGAAASKGRAGSLAVEPSQAVISKLQGSECKTSTGGAAPANSLAGRSGHAGQRSSVDVSVLSTGRKVVTHSVQLQRNTSSVHAASTGKNTLEQQACVRKAGSSPAHVPKPMPLHHKRCRVCANVRPFGAFFEDRRMEDGVAHICAECATKRGLSGKLASMPIPAAKKTASARPAHAACVSQNARPAPGSASAGARPANQSAEPRGFYDSGAPRAPAVRAARAAMRGSPMRRPALDEYEDDGFIDDGDAEDEAMDELRKVTRKFYREIRDDRGFNDRMMEASWADMKREEARSKRMGRQEDDEEERLELLRQQAKEEKKRKGKKRKRKSGMSMFVDDEVSEDSDEDDADD